ncbi:MAG: cytochrome ubiquinol oxidase subunit I [Candidatus Binatia bacterium]
MQDPRRTKAGALRVINPFTGKKLSGAIETLLQPTVSGLQSRLGAVERKSLWALFFVCLGIGIFTSFPSLAQETGAQDYRTFFGLDPRLVIWIVAQLHLMYGAFVLGVPIFAVIVEYIGKRTGDPKYDHLAREFTKLLSAAFSTTAALGGLMAFTLFGLYPKFMGYLTGVFHQSYYVYALLFFAEGFTLYLYYYSWDRFQGKRKGLHIFLGVLLNVWGTILMLIANSWVSFMMSPSGINKETGAFLGSTWLAVHNPLWIPLSIHRFIANVAFGGLIAGAYAAVKFLGARTEAEKAHYDWMGYVGNFVAIGALIPLPFAGYYLGREVYSASPVMGNNMMGGTFSWTFIIQAILIGVLFIGANYYLWVGMGRIAGAERYHKYIKYINFILLISFAVWLTPHNLPLSAAEQLAIGGQYHPVLKWLGLMSAKNAVVNLIILSTFFSFLLYRRGNKGKIRPFAEHGVTAKVILLSVGVLCALFLGFYARGLFNLDPAAMDLSPDKGQYFKFPGWLLLIQIAAIFIAIGMTFRNRGVLGQGLLLAVTVASTVFALGIYGFVIMEKANPFLRNIAVSQFLMVIACLVVNTFIDIFLFKNAEVVGGIRWGKMPIRSQYTLLLLCITIVLLMGLMGYIRSGLREDWHIYGVMRDTSAWAFTPTMAYMAKAVSGIVFLFLASVSFVFWLAGLGEEQKHAPTPVAGNVDEVREGGRT